ncbi:hypothetical protein MKX01_037180 [Papaver californicum]|nr:hypothetical protein MKX01_037180 [Papaver californicum]
MGEESVEVIMEEHSVDRIPREATKILISLASSWGDTIDKNSLKVIPLKGAMTNEVYQINWATQKGELPQKVLVRFYGEGVDVFFNRKVEINTFECMSKHGQGPRLLGRFSNGRIEGFIHARNWLSFAKQVCPPEEARVFMLDSLDEEITILEKEISGSTDWFLS